MNIIGSLEIREFIGMKPMIADLRKSKGLMQMYVADKIGVKQQQLSNWENGKAYPRHDYAIKLAKVLGVEVGELYKEE